MTLPQEGTPDSPIITAEQARELHARVLGDHVEAVGLGGEPLIESHTFHPQNALLLRQAQQIADEYEGQMII